MSDKKICNIRQFSDSEMCMTCGNLWDVNDCHPPKCKIKEPEKKKKAWFLSRFLAKIFAAKVN